MADGKIFEDTILVTTLKADSSEGYDTLLLDLPFKIFGLNVISNGIDVTDYIGRPEILDRGFKEGDEVLAKVDYKVSNQKEVNKFLGIIKGEIVENVKYVEHYSVKNEDKYALLKPDGSYEKYTGIDKNETAKFTEWVD